MGLSPFMEELVRKTMFKSRTEVLVCDLRRDLWQQCKIPKKNFWAVIRDLKRKGFIVYENGTGRVKKVENPL